MLSEWLDRAWVLTWGSIVLSTILLCVSKISEATWWNVVQLCTMGFFGIQIVRSMGQAAADAKAGKPVQE